MNREHLFEQNLVIDAVLCNIEIIERATKHILDVRACVRARMPGVEWKRDIQHPSGVEGGV